MRILHVLSERGFSGGEHQLLRLLRHLAACGHESILVLNPGAQFAAHATVMGLEVRTLPMRNDADLRATWRLRRAIRGCRPDLVHLACSRSHKLGAHASIGLARCPRRVATRRMDYPLRRTPYRHWLYARAVQGIVAVSEGVRDQVLKTGIDPARVHLIRDGVDTRELAVWREPSRRESARAEFGLAEGVLCGVTVASLHRRKGQDVLLAALREVTIPPSASRLVWICAGEGPMRSELLALSRDLPSHVELRLPGQIATVEPLLAAADVFCLPSRYEGLGVALLEAMAVGVPVVASAVGGIREAVLADRTGTLVPAEDPPALAAAISHVLADPDHARALAAAAIGRVEEHFSVEDMCRATEKLYARLVC